MLRVYNTMSGRKEPLLKASKRLNVFVCGPTVYGHIHVGNARTFVNFDIIVRYMRSLSYKLFYLQNITDVDDKIIVRAAKEKKTWRQIARHYESIYKKDAKALNIISVDKYARATDHIPEIVQQVQKLIKKGHAYEIPGDGWYFDLKTFSGYGKLSGRTALQAEDAVSRVDASNLKRNRGDFCLWKFSKPGEPIWKTKLGDGRPGWHIEDTAITEHYFGPQYDIHGGGIDLIFPHHEAEVAQQESASGQKPFVRLWMHCGFLVIHGGRMGKSKGNFVTASEFLKHHPGDIFRMLTLNHHYRAPMEYATSSIDTAEKNIAELRAFIAKLVLAEKKAEGKGEVSLGAYDKKFHAAMEDDFNTPEAVAAIFELMHAANKNLWKLSKSEVRRVRIWLQDTLKMLGFKQITLKIPSKIREISRKRELSRRSKQFMQADALRKEAEALGYTIEDTPVGPLVLPN